MFKCYLNKISHYLVSHSPAIIEFKKMPDCMPEKKIQNGFVHLNHLINYQGFVEMYYDLIVSG